MNRPDSIQSFIDHDNSLELRQSAFARFRQQQLIQIPEPEPECRCIQTDVDMADASDCPVHGYTREYLARDIEAEAAWLVSGDYEGCPF